ncbi:MAG: hypothetical protein ABID38_05160 [Candidatus Diapherotrites archaeon]
MDSKAQSALEYLMTYGWALIVIIIVVAALFAFGIFNPPAAARCAGLDKLLYKDHAVSAAGDTITIAFGNGAGSTIDVTGVAYGGDFAGGADASTITNIGSGGNFSVNNSDALDTAFTAAVTGTYNGTITITYTTDSGIIHIETTTCSGTA